MTTSARSNLLDLYHGTSREAVEAIVREGIHAADARAVAAKVARQHKVNFEDVWVT